MYDFILDSEENIDRNPKRWLLSIKRMLPRWINGLPDSEYLALYDTLELLEKNGNPNKSGNCVLIETGCGCSTIVLLYFAIKWDTELYSWDISSNKMASLRSILNDTIFRHFNKENLFNRWKYVPFDSTSKYAGIPILKELNKKVILGFYDSEHTWKTLNKELINTIPLMIDEGAICIDDGNYCELEYNEAYINMIRNKIGLSKVSLENNKSDMFWKETESLLEQNFVIVNNLQGNGYKENMLNDISLEYYSIERESTNNLDMLKSVHDLYRFNAWIVSKYKK